MTTEVTTQPKKSARSIGWLVFDILRFSIIIGLVTIVLYIYAIALNIDKYKIVDIYGNITYIVTPGEDISTFLIQYVMPFVLVGLLLLWAFIQIFFGITKIVNKELTHIQNEDDMARVEYFKSGHTIANLSIEDKSALDLRYYINNKYVWKSLAIIGMWIISLMLLIIFFTLPFNYNYSNFSLIGAISGAFIICFSVYYYMNHYYTKTNYMTRKIKYDEQMRNELVKKGLL